MQKWRQWETAPDADWDTAVEREPLIRTLAEEERLTKEQLQQAMLALRVRRGLLYKLLHRYRQRPQTSSLLPWKRGRCEGVRLLAPEREELLKSCIREFYLTLERPSMAAFIREGAGSKWARDRLCLVGISTLRADLSLDIVQIEDTLVDVSVVDREHRL